MELYRCRDKVVEYRWKHSNDAHLLAWTSKSLMHRHQKDAIGLVANDYLFVDFVSIILTE